MLENNAVNKNLLTGYSNIHPHLEVKDSPIQGKGLFTEVYVSKATILFEIMGKRFQHDYDPSLSQQNPNWIGIGHEEWLELGPGDIAIYLNHSCNPNVIINGKLQLITMKPLKAQEELLLDYSTTELDPYWKMDCGCGADECRKVLHSFQLLPDKLQKKYRKYLAPAFRSTAEVLALHQRAS